MTKRRVARRGRARTKTPEKKSDLEVLEELQARILQALKDEGFQPKVGDFLRVLDFKLKLKLPGEEKKKLWDFIEQIRKEELQGEDESA